MTEISFHFNAPDKQAYVCRFARKAIKHGARLVILAEESQLASLSSKLWAVSPTDFLAHSRISDGVQSASAAPIVLTASLVDLPHHDVLVNLTAQVPESFEQFARLVEVVSSIDDMDRHEARERWKTYAARGYAIVRHDLNLKG